MATASNTQFKLSGPHGDKEHQSGSAVTLYCHLAPEISAVTMEIRWFKETDCVCLYKNRQVTEGRGYKGRVSLFTQELQRGNVSLQIRDCTWSDTGIYLCQVTNGHIQEECTVEMRGFKEKWWFSVTGGKRESLRIDKAFVFQWNRKWTEEERKKMEKSVVLTEPILLRSSSHFIQKASGSAKTRSLKAGAEPALLSPDKEQNLQPELQVKESSHADFLRRLRQRMKTGLDLQSSGSAKRRSSNISTSTHKFHSFSETKDAKPHIDDLPRKLQKQKFKTEDVSHDLLFFGSAKRRSARTPTSKSKYYSGEDNFWDNLRSDEFLVKDSSPTSSKQPYNKHLSVAVERFIPEMFESNSENNNSYRFLCPCAGQFQCSLTNLVFEMEGEGEVLYRIDSWDTRIFQDSLRNMEPAGPLYSIDCFKGSLSRLHFPHCEIQYAENQVELVVAHFSVDNMESITPLTVTNTHAIISVQGLSLFGLLKKMILYPSPIRAQILLFYKEMMDKRKRKKLHIHLLPRNVPVQEVEKKHKSSIYFETSSTCQLIPGRRYKPFCGPYVSEPKVAEFECDYGPNYHPTFVVFLQADEVTVSLLTEDGTEVWEPHQILLTAAIAGYSTETSPLTAEAGAEFVDRHRTELIKRVSSVMEIVDCLRSKNMITEEMYSAIQSTKPSQAQMRILYGALKSTAVKVEFYEILKKNQRFLVDELEAGPSRV